MSPARPELLRPKRLVLKLGTRVLTAGDGPVATERLEGLVDAVAELHGRGVEVLVVSSGAVGLGRAALGFETAPRLLADRQACAAVGQSRLMGLYQQGFERRGLVAAQVLLTESDLDDRLRYLNLRSTLTALLGRGVVPIINENDAVSTDELAFVEGAARPVFGDNDRLSALIATKLEADLLVILTDVDGVYDQDPRDATEVALIDRVDPSDYEDVAAAASSGTGDLGRGGMKSKVLAALVAARSGCHAVIASGTEPRLLLDIVAGERVGTWFPARAGLSARDRWIAFAAAPRGTLHLDAGAVAALRQRGASLLAVGVARIEGRFERGDIVEFTSPEGQTLGRGIVHCDSEAALRWSRGETPEGVRNHDALVHRDNLVLDEPLTQDGVDD